MVNLGSRCHRRFPASLSQPLFDGDRWWNPDDQVDFGLVQYMNVLSCVSRQAFNEPALSFREQNVEGQGALSRSGKTRDDDELVPWNVDREVLQVVVACSQDLYGISVVVRTAGEGSGFDLRGGFFEVRCQMSPGV